MTITLRTLVASALASERTALVRIGRPVDGLHGDVASRHQNRIVLIPAESGRSLGSRSRSGTRSPPEMIGTSLAA